MASQSTNAWEEQYQNFGNTRVTTIDKIGGIHCHICNLRYPNKAEYDQHYAHHNTEEKETIYTCVICYKQIAGYRSFQGHCYLKHVVKDRFSCLHCSKSCSKQSVLLQHIQTMHTFECKICQQSFSSKNELVLHNLIHKTKLEKTTFPCLSCGSSIESTDTCELHVDELATLTYPCPICEETFPSRSEILKHITKYFDDTPEPDIIRESKALIDDCSVEMLGIFCSFCDETFNTRLEYDTHFMSEHSDKELVYTCAICRKPYYKYSLFSNHCHFHKSKGRFECSECGKLFPRLSLLVPHRAAHGLAGEADGDRLFSCALCSRSFCSLARLTHHHRADHPSQHVTCQHDRCGLRFESYKDLIIHQSSHSDEIRCRHCALQLNSFSSCEMHLDVHVVKNYACPICNRRYGQKYMLMKHIPTHFEAVFHICTTCGKSFNHKSRLVEHAKSHTVRQFKCSYCGKTFTKESALLHHENIHTGSRPYQCSECPKNFANYSNWHKHITKVHNIQPKMKMAQAKTETPAKKNYKKKNNEKTVIVEQKAVEETIMDTDDSTVGSIDPVTLEKEIQMYHENNNVDSLDGLELAEMLPENSAVLVTDPQPTDATFQTSVVPLEYGPDFVNKAIESSAFSGDYIDLDDHLMPHIDPLLTIKQELLTRQHWQYQPYYEEDTARLHVVNTNIF